MTTYVVYLLPLPFHVQQSLFYTYTRSLSLSLSFWDASSHDIVMFSFPAAMAYDSCISFEQFLFRSLCTLHNIQYNIQHSRSTFHNSHFTFPHVFHSFYRLFFSFPVAAFLQSRFNCLVYSQSWIVWSFVVFVVVVVVVSAVE